MDAESKVDGTRVHATALHWNQELSPNAETKFGFVVNGSGTEKPPNLTAREISSTDTEPIKPITENKSIDNLYHRTS